MCSSKNTLTTGTSGTQLDRPALEQMRQDAKVALFDAIYFLTFLTFIAHSRNIL
jgi:hypothetical protein